MMWGTKVRFIEKLKGVAVVNVIQVALQNGVELVCNIASLITRILHVLWT